MHPSLFVLVPLLVIVLMLCKATKMHFMMATLTVGFIVFAYHHAWWQSLVLWFSFGLIGLPIIAYNSGGTFESQWKWCNRNPPYAVGILIVAIIMGLITLCTSLQMIEESKKRRVGLSTSSTSS